MKIATQSDLDIFFSYAILEPTMYPYISASTYVQKWEIPKDDWTGIYLTDSRLSYMVKINFDRTRAIEFNIALYAKSSIAAGRACLAIQNIIDRYKPRAINSVVHRSNIKSQILHSKIYGMPWGIEINSAWNSMIGEYEDLLYYRKLL